MYLEPSQTSTIEFSAEIVNDLLRKKEKNWLGNSGAAPESSLSWFCYCIILLHHHNDFDRFS